MQINRGVTSVPHSLIFNELLFGECYKCEQIVDDLFVCAYIECGQGRSKVKIAKLVSLTTGEIFNQDQVRTWRFRLANASVSV
uniref:Uncharacterized protein n=3 Tax=unclassified bacterial viruses TaxID=12333 RepID=A0AAU6W0N8_9VIRU